MGAFTSQRDRALSSPEICRKGVPSFSDGKAWKRSRLGATRLNTSRPCGALGNAREQGAQVVV
jgi:hypothetical protein